MQRPSLALPLVFTVSLPSPSNSYLFPQLPCINTPRIAAPARCFAAACRSAGTVQAVQRRSVLLYVLYQPLPPRHACMHPIGCHWQCQSLKRRVPRAVQAECQSGYRVIHMWQPGRHAPLPRTQHRPSISTTVLTLVGGTCTGCLPSDAQSSRAVHQPKTKRCCSKQQIMTQQVKQGEFVFVCAGVPACGQQLTDSQHRG